MKNQNTHTCVCGQGWQNLLLAQVQVYMPKPSITDIEQFVINSVREKRIKKGISQAELAHLLEVSEGFIGNVESSNYRAKYNLNHINALAKILECSPRDFLPKSSI